MTDAPEPPTHARSVTIDLDKLRVIGILGVNRAAGFLGLAFRRQDEPLPTTLSVGGFNHYEFLPEPLAPELAASLVAEFNSWLVGNALLELDRHFSLFVDEVWRLLDLTDMHQKVMTQPFEVTEISTLTNASTKYEKVSKRLNIDQPHGARLWSISNARNCLAHAAGRVRDRDANDDKKRLKLVWLAMEVTLRQGDVAVVLDKPMEAPDPSQEATVAMQMVERAKCFEIGEAIILTPLELQELCLYYSIIIDAVMRALSDDFTTKGIPSLRVRQGTTAA